MRTPGPALFLLIALGANACRAPVDSNPLILDGEDAARGPRVLTAGQSDALRAHIVAAGEECKSVGRTYLEDLAPDFHESWNVACGDVSYRVVIAQRKDPAAFVQRCEDTPNPLHDAACFQPAVRDLPPSLSSDLPDLLDQHNRR